MAKADERIIFEISSFPKNPSTKHSLQTIGNSTRLRYDQNEEKNLWGVKELL